MDKTLLHYELLLEVKDQMKVFGESTLEDEVKKFKERAVDKNYTYINRPDSVIIEIVSINQGYIFGSYGRLSNIDSNELIRSRNIDDYSSEYLESLIETYTYFLLDLKTKQIVLLDNYKCGGFITYFTKFLREKFHLNNYFDNISIVVKKDDNIEERLFKPHNLERINIQYSTRQLVNNDFVTPRELYQLESSSIRKATITLDLESRVENSKLKKLVFKDENIPEKFSKFDIETNEGLINLVERKITKKTFIQIDEGQLKNLTAIEELLLANLTTEN